MSTVKADVFDKTRHFIADRNGVAQSEAGALTTTDQTPSKTPSETPLKSCDTAPPPAETNVAQSVIAPIDSTRYQDPDSVRQETTTSQQPDHPSPAAAQRPALKLRQEDPATKTISTVPTTLDPTDAITPDQITSSRASPVTPDLSPVRSLSTSPLRLNSQPPIKGKLASSESLSENSATRPALQSVGTMATAGASSQITGNGTRNIKPPQEEGPKIDSIPIREPEVLPAPSSASSSNRTNIHPTNAGASAVFPRPELIIQLPGEQKTLCHQNIRLEPIEADKPMWRELSATTEERCARAGVTKPMSTCRVIVTGVSSGYIFTVKQDQKNKLRMYHDFMRLKAAKQDHIATPEVDTVYSVLLEGDYYRCKFLSLEGGNISLFLIDRGHIVTVSNATTKLQLVSENLAAKPVLAQPHTLFECSVKNRGMFQQLASLVLLNKEVEMLEYGDGCADFLLNNDYHVAALSTIGIAANCLQRERIPECNVNPGEPQQFLVVNQGRKLWLQPTPPQSYSTEDGVSWEEKLQNCELRPLGEKKAYCIVERSGERARGQILESFSGDFTVLLIDKGEVVERVERMWDLPQTFYSVPAKHCHANALTTVLAQMNHTLGYRYETKIMSVRSVISCQIQQIKMLVSSIMYHSSSHSHSSFCLEACR
eukprot:sb/3462828/